MFWQLTIDCHDPDRLAEFWCAALGYQRTPPDGDAPWLAHYRQRLGARLRFPDRIFDPQGVRPPIWLQQVPEGKESRKNRLHVDIYPTGREPGLSYQQARELVDAKVSELAALGATVVHSEGSDDPSDTYYFVTLQDPEGNEFCLG